MSEESAGRASTEAPPARLECLLLRGRLATSVPTYFLPLSMARMTAFSASTMGMMRMARPMEMR